MAVSLSPYLKDKLEQAQRLQSELETIMNQRYQLEVSLKETEKSIEELEKLDENAIVYKSVGAILVKVKSNEDIKKELEENKEMVELRLKTIAKQQELLENKLKEIQSEFAKYGGGSKST